MPKTETLPWDMADHLKTREDIALYLEAALEDGDPKLIAATLEDIARATETVELPQESRFGWESLNKTLTNLDKASFSTVVQVLKTLGIRFSADNSTSESESSSLNELHCNLNSSIQQLSIERLQILSDFAAYLADAESEEATQELSAIPGLLERFKKNQTTPRERYTDWRPVRSDI